jgi:hypothetical protein
MAREMKKVGLELTHIIGPKTGHSYEKGAKEEVNRRIDAIVEKGRVVWPEKSVFTTYTLRYSFSGNIALLGLGKHWERARVESERKGNTWTLMTENVTALLLAKRIADNDPTVVIDGTTFGPEQTRVPVFHKADGKWHWGAPPETDTGLAKDERLQGPIDHAFMSSFVMVKPTGNAMNDNVGTWAEKEMKHAIDHWRKQFRGDAPVKSDTEIRDDDIKNNNLVLWGDPMSNAVLAKIADKLPIKWTDKGIAVGKDSYAAATHVPVLIYPNPLNPKKYVVINSGFTFREYDQLNNARQVPKLPDYAVIDITTPPNSRYPGKIVRAGFFGEKWELLPDDGK